MRCAAESPAEPLFADAGEADPYHPAVTLVGTALHEGRGFGPVDEFDCAVMAHQEVARHVADGWRLAARVTLDRQQQLMLRGRQAGLPGACLAPAEELPQAGPEREQVFVVCGRERPFVTHSGASPRKGGQNMMTSCATLVNPGPWAARRGVRLPFLQSSLWRKDDPAQPHVSYHDIANPGITEPTMIVDRLGGRVSGG